MEVDEIQTGENQVSQESLEAIKDYIQQEEGVRPSFGNNKPAPETPGQDAPAFDYSKLGVEGIGSKEDLDRILENAKQYEQLKPQFEKLTSQEAKPKYASDISAKIDEMYANNIPLNQIQKFLEFQSLDIDNLSDDEALRYKLRYENPQLDENDINALFEHQRSQLKDEDGNDIPFQVANYKKSAIEAKSYLRDLKVNSEPEEIRNRKAAVEQMNALRTNWTDIGQTALYDTVKIGQTLEVEGDESVKFEIPLPPELKADISKIVANELAQRNVPLTRENVQTAIEYMQGAYIMQNWRAVLSDAMKLAYSQASERKTLELSGTRTPKPPEPGNEGNLDQNQKRQASLEAFKRKESPFL